MEAKNYNNEIGIVRGLFSNLISIIGLILLIILYKGNQENYHILLNNYNDININIFNLFFDMTYKYLTDMQSFAIQSSKYINLNGFNFSNFFNIYKIFASNFSNLISIVLIYISFYLRQSKSLSPAIKIIKIASNFILIMGTAFLLSIALN